MMLNSDGAMKGLNGGAWSGGVLRDSDANSAYIAELNLGCS